MIKVERIKQALAVVNSEADQMLATCDMCQQCYGKNNSVEPLRDCEQLRDMIFAGVWEIKKKFAAYGYDPKWQIEKTAEKEAV